MAEKLLVKIHYTQRSLTNVREIRDYLLYHFTQREVDNLYSRLADFEKIVLSFPILYPLISDNKKIRRAVLGKQLSVFYTYSKSTISIVAILDNRMDTAKIPGS
jgi:plasmid stabilization system protein ParE